MDFAETLDEFMSGVLAFCILKGFDTMKIYHSFALPVDDRGFFEEHQMLSDHIRSLLSEKDEISVTSLFCLWNDTSKS
jgi:hypothetical protein